MISCWALLGLAQGVRAVLHHRPPQPAAKRAGGGKRVTAPCGRIGSRKSTVIPCYTSMKALTQLVFSSLAAHRSPDSSGVQREAALAPLSSRCQVGSCGGSLRNLGLSAMLQGHLHRYALVGAPPGPFESTRAFFLRCEHSPLLLGDWDAG